MSKNSIIFFFVSQILASCSLSTLSNTPTKYNVVESSLGRADVTEAINYANDVLAANKIQMSLMWSTGKNAQIRVIIVQPDGLPFNTIAQSVPQDNIIFVSSNWKKQCDEMFDWAGFDKEISTSPKTLALILLHETGHIVKYKPKELLFDLAKLKLADSSKMKDEIFADIFAITELKKWENKSARQLKVQLQFLESKIRDVYNWKYSPHGSVLSWMAKDIRKEFGDFSPSHPNMNLRFRIMGYYLDPTTEKLADINWAIERREVTRDLPYPEDIPKPTYLKNIPDSQYKTR